MEVLVLELALFVLVVGVVVEGDVGPPEEDFLLVLHLVGALAEPAVAGETDAVAQEVLEIPEVVLDQASDVLDLDVLVRLQQFPELRLRNRVVAPH